MSPLAVRTRAAVALVAALAAGTAPRPSDPPSSELSPTLTDFGREAARRCTELLNTHPLATEEAEPATVLVAVLELDRAGGVPTGADLEDWAATLQTEIVRRGDIRASLATLQSDVPAEQSAWEEIVAGEDAFADVLGRRLELVETGTWDDITGGFLPGSGAPDNEVVEAALATLAIPESDCRFVFSSFQAGVDDEWHQFRSDAASACTTIWMRRADAGYEDDTALALDAFVALLSPEPGPLPDGADAALDRLSAEWLLTTDDLTAVGTSGASAPDEWQDVVDASAERAMVFAERADAARSGDPETMREAFSADRFEHPGLDFISVGLDQRCSAVRG